MNFLEREKEERERIFFFFSFLTQFFNSKTKFFKIIFEILAYFLKIFI